MSEMQKVRESERDAASRRAGRMYEALRGAGFIEGDPWKLRDSVYRHSFTEAVQKGTARDV